MKHLTINAYRLIHLCNIDFEVKVILKNEIELADTVDTDATRRMKYLVMQQCKLDA